MSIRTFVQEHGIPCCSTAYIGLPWYQDKTNMKYKTVKILPGIQKGHTQNIWNSKHGSKMFKNPGTRQRPRITGQINSGYLLELPHRYKMNIYYT
jgi:hypothetical protein